MDSSDLVSSSTSGEGHQSKSYSTVPDTQGTSAAVDSSSSPDDGAGAGGKGTSELCQICDGPASGFHCGAFVCEACKKFFIRTAKKADQPPKSVCAQASGHPDQMCSITKNSRTSCSHCRYKKCMQLGMQPPGHGLLDTHKITSLPCKVCSSPSSGYHFGVLTCEGCKGFYRRVIQDTGSSKANLLLCQKEGRCNINAQSRSMCRACRYNKCVSVGMSKHATRIGRQPNSVRYARILANQVVKDEKTSICQDPIPCTLSHPTSQDQDQTIQSLEKAGLSAHTLTELSSHGHSLSLGNQQAQTTVAQSQYPHTATYSPTSQSLHTGNYNPTSQSPHTGNNNPISQSHTISSTSTAYTLPTQTIQSNSFMLASSFHQSNISTTLDGQSMGNTFTTLLPSNYNHSPAISYSQIVTQSQPDNQICHLPPNQSAEYRPGVSNLDYQAAISTADGQSFSPINSAACQSAETTPPRTAIDLTIKTPGTVYQNKHLIDVLVERFRSFNLHFFEDAPDDEIIMQTDDYEVMRATYACFMNGARVYLPFLRNIDGLVDLSLDDKVILTKCSFYRNIMLASSTRYDLETGRHYFFSWRGWREGPDKLLSVVPTYKVIDKHMRYFNREIREMDCTDQELALVAALNILNKDCLSDMKNPETIVALHERYMSLLTTHVYETRDNPEKRMSQLYRILSLCKIAAGEHMRAALQVTQLHPQFNDLAAQNKNVIPALYREMYGTVTNSLLNVRADDEPLPATATGPS